MHLFRRKRTAPTAADGATVPAAEARPGTTAAEPSAAVRSPGGVPLEKVQATAPGLVSLVKTAGVSLTKRGLTGQRAAVYLVLDHSGSMTPYYRDGSMQRLAEQVLALSVNLDDDGVVPTILFGSRAYAPVEIGLTDYRGRVDREHRRHATGSTNYAAAIRAVVKHYQAAGPADPGFVVFQTDGEPDSRAAAEAALRKAADLPIFWQFIGFGHRFEFLRHLDRLPGRRVDNAGFFATKPGALPDAQLYDELTAAFPRWLSAARAAGIVG